VKLFLSEIATMAFVFSDELCQGAVERKVYSPGLKPGSSRIDFLNCPLDPSGASPARLNGDVLRYEHLHLKRTTI
jgi:hypothetical protein